MEVKRNGRLTSHEVHLDITEPEPYSSKASKGKIWPFKVVISYQFLWSEGKWVVLGVVLLGHRNPNRRGDGVKLSLYQEENWPTWLHGHVLAQTPKTLAQPEVARS